MCLLDSFSRTKPVFWLDLVYMSQTRENIERLMFF
jgi:hypothetical protein